MAASCLPYHTSGYTTRTHEVIGALRSAGLDVRVITKPGYPWDRKDRLCDPAGLETTVNEVSYRHFRQPSALRPVLQFAYHGVKPIMESALSSNVSLIHAASNHVNALPALLAARKLGIPFHYEMRGLWELTRISRMPRYEHSQAFKQGLALEALVATSADKVYVISEQLAKYVQEHWNVDPKRIALLPNCIDPDKFEIKDVSVFKPRTIGYAGSLIGYEGLDVLLQAVAILRERGQTFDVNIIGDGEARSQLEQLSTRLGVNNSLHFFGRKSPKEARDLISQCELVCLPRKPFLVCEIVTPIKLVEALALAKPVVVPDLPVFRDELRMTDVDSAGLFFKSGNAEDLARVLEEAFSDNQKLQNLGAKGRAHVLHKRRWELYVQDIADRAFA